LDANEQAIAPHNLTAAARLPILGEKQLEMLRQLAVILKLDATAGIRDINDGTGIRPIAAFDNDGGVIVELPARTFSQFGSAAKIADNDHHKISCMDR
jgi:hypothetical protein